MIMPDVLIVENYRTMSALGIMDTILAIGLPYMASAFGIFLLRQTFKTVPQRARRGGARRGLRAAADRCWKVYVPLARPAYLAYALVSVQLSLEQFPVAADHHQLGRVSNT